MMSAEGEHGEGEGGGASIRFHDWGYRHASRRGFAVRNLNLYIEPGEHVLLLGASGIGKSTILEATAGLLGSQDESAAASDEDSADGEFEVPASQDSEGGVSEGLISIGGVPAVRARGKVGLVLQDPDAQAVFERAGDNVAFGPENMGVPRDEIWRRVNRALDATGLEGLQLHRSTMHLSGGQMQRLALAGALAMQPDVLLLDEPTANLDPDGVMQIVQAVRSSLEVTDATMVLVEHRTDPWMDLIDRVVVLGHMQNGEGDPGTGVIADGTPAEVFGASSIDFTKLGIWVPESYRRPRDEIRRIHTDGETASASQATGSEVISTRDLAVGRDGKAIAEHIDLGFSAGQITAIVGRNGTGKSTLALTLAGLLEPVSGAVRASPELVGDADGDSPYAWSSPQLAARISYVFQNPEHQFAKGSVLEEVMLGPLQTGMDEDEARSNAERLLQRFGLDQYASANPYTLSGGEKRRLTVASALAAAPKVVILDEPTFGQDRTTWMEIAELIESLRADGVAIIVITHDRDLVTALGAKVVELEAGYTDESTRVQDGALEPAQGVPASEAWHEAVERVEVSRVNTRKEDEKPSSRSKFLTTLNPAYRLIGGFLAALPLIVTLDWVSACAALVLEFTVLWAIGLRPLRVVRSTWPVFVGAPGSALAVLLYGKSGGTVWWHWGMVQITDRSALLAVATGVRVLAVGIPAIIAVLGIDATDLADSFSQVLHLPDRFVYGGLAGMRMFSVLRDDWAALTASRRSRGLGDENKVKAFFPQAFALIVLSIRRSTTLSVAMEARGFGSSLIRTHARVSEVHVRDRLFVLGCLAIPCIALSTALFAGTFVFFGG